MSDRIPIFGRDFVAWSPPEVRWKWMWITCVSPFCGHARAVAFAPWAIRWSPEDVGAAMRRHFKCGVCGRKGCIFVRPALDHRGVEAFPAGNEVRMGGERVIPESSAEHDARVLAAYLARYPSGDPFKTADAMCNLYSLKRPQQEIRDLVRATRDLTGNLPPLPAIFPDAWPPLSGWRLTACENL